ncbi:MAG TPA: hypothetical protein VGK17_21465 [Propionicimonas sp.]
MDDNDPRSGQTLGEGVQHRWPRNRRSRQYVLVAGGYPDVELGEQTRSFLIGHNPVVEGLDRCEPLGGVRRPICQVGPDSGQTLHDGGRVDQFLPFRCLVDPEEQYFQRGLRVMAHQGLGNEVHNGARQLDLSDLLEHEAVQQQVRIRLRDANLSETLPDPLSTGSPRPSSPRELGTDGAVRGDTDGQVGLRMQATDLPMHEAALLLGLKVAQGQGLGPGFDLARFHEVSAAVDPKVLGSLWLNALVVAERRERAMQHIERLQPEAP